MPAIAYDKYHGELGLPPGTKAKLVLSNGTVIPNLNPKDACVMACSKVKGTFYAVNKAEVIVEELLPNGTVRERVIRTIHRCA